MILLLIPDRLFYNLSADQGLEAAESSMIDGFQGSWIVKYTVRLTINEAD